MTDEREADGGRFTAAARQADPDRFLCILPAPAARREALCALILFNHELVRATELPSARSGAGPIATLIRLQWWREVIEGGRDDWRKEPVAAAMRDLLDRGSVGAAPLLDMIAAREAETEAPMTLAGWRDGLLGGAGGLQRAIGAMLGVGPGHEARLAAVGAAFACGALRRYLPQVLQSGRDLLPADWALADLAAQRAFLREQGALFLREADGPALTREQIVALLPLVLARRDLRGDGSSFDRTGGARGIGDRLAVIRTALFGRSGRGGL